MIEKSGSAMSKNTKHAIEDRQGQIAYFLANKDSVSVQELSDRFGVSMATMRRDINSLIDRQVVLRNRDGSISTNDAVGFDPNVFRRSSAHLQRKRAIAKAALQHIHKGDVVGLNSSSTVLQLVKLLPSAGGDLTVVTNSLLIATGLVDKSGIELYNVGGKVSLQGLASTGSTAVEEINKFSFDVAFSSATAVDVEFGVSVNDILFAGTDAAFLDHAKRRILLADSSKLGKRGARRFYSINDIDLLITDSLAKPEYLQRLRDAGVQVEVAPVQ